MNGALEEGGRARRGAAAVLLAVAFLIAACADERTRPEAGPTSVSVHPAGILDPASADFHGRQLARYDWDFAVCARCHGDDFSGGVAKKSCLGCHAEGPTACTTCHGAAGPTSNAHVVHREVAKLPCSECHVVPARWDAEGHIRRGGVADPPPAEVVFGARAQLTATAGDRSGPATFADGRCSNVYCHGDTIRVAGGTATQPRWDDPASAGACDRCHGAPPPSHAQDRCVTCHPADAPHIDGVVQIGREPGCSGCHGDQSSPAPPNDLSGNRLTTAIGVGAHRAHLQAPSRLSGPIACETCHKVPSQIGDPGHIDSPLPAEVNPELSWDRTTQTCGTSPCHGPARPVWTTTGGAVCGSCHGIPPASPSHPPGMTLTSCAACHPETVDATGTILLTPGPGGTVTSKHINGVIDVL